MLRTIFVEIDQVKGHDPVVKKIHPTKKAMQYHAPMPLDFDALARRRKELQIEERLQQMKRSTSRALSNAVDEQAKQVSERAKMVKDVLKLIPKPSESQKEQRKRNRERMKQSLFLPTQRASPNT